MRTPLTFLAPVHGTVRLIADVPDPVFAEEIVGPGVAIDPDTSGPSEAVAPIAGVVAKLHPHAFVVQGADGRAALVHLGLDTVQLAGEGFTLLAAEGDEVAAGDPIVSWVPADVVAGGRSPVCPVVALQGEPGSVTPLAAPGTTVHPGTPLLTWT
ncbi:PTS sugar transporter subunit IIA [Sanguibacter antarcticus]|uniref:PTS system glucose-specific IIA component/PTS system N-acetylglucosamine-specific IIA component n=1 Tax=Sanguibacter antarcticus TaxID=372484 RepID=A0A2A9E5V7_9MICO|nr:PTS glucose transporter subunit IIA [Sanguibacter antarcticus]PFG34234.1 PTS system glucose-specific IIA component/PTS system N-acetylglucosamine-specific IIA component [Sanguibacter antarcticus]